MRKMILEAMPIRYTDGRVEILHSPLREELGRRDLDDRFGAGRTDYTVREQVMGWGQWQAVVDDRHDEPHLVRFEE